MQAQFDNAAATYDKDFTETIIGQNQRKRVWKLLSKILEGKKLNILELNCGTGEDAVWLARQGHNVWATDVSAEMLLEVHNKITLNECSNYVKTSILDLAIPNIEQFNNQQFDLIFSNFGGLNCLNSIELNQLLAKLPDLIKKEGKLVLVIMPPNSLYENMASLIKNSVKKLRSDGKQSKKVNVNGKMIETWYYEAKDVLPNNFKPLVCKPTGFLPSYAKNHANKNSLFYKIWYLFEEFCFKTGSFSAKADHYYLEMQKPV